MDEDAEELVTCPYNTCHRISKKRLPAHLYKCKKQHPNVNLAICDFNATHHVPEAELVYHHQHCPSRKKLEAFIYLEEGNATNQYPVHNIGVETVENWDDSNVPTYDAEKYCMHHGVLRKLDVAPPSKKKEFQRQERERLKVVESPICDFVERCVPDENLEKEKVARQEKRIAALKELIRQRGVAKPTTEKQVQEGTNETHISHEIDKPATKEDRSAVLKDLIRRGLKTPFTPKK